MSCNHELHLELLHFAMQSTPLMVVICLLPDEEGNLPTCEGGTLQGPDAGGERKDVFEGEECHEEAWCTAGFPGLDPETDQPIVGAMNLCRRHLALLILQGDELVTTRESLGS